MSSKIPRSEYFKESAAKCRVSMNKENMFTVVQSGKSSEGKNSGKKKGLSLNAENCAVRMTSVQNFSVGKAKFPIYFDDNNENVRSRPRVRKDVCRKEIRARERNSQAQKRDIVSKVEEINDPNSRMISRRAQSLSNYRHKVPLDKMIEKNNKLRSNRRCYSESRKISPQYAGVVRSSDNQKIKYLTDDVKKRTFSSIQMWKDKMRKPHTGTIPKNIAANGDKKHVKAKLPKSSVVETINLQSEMSQNPTDVTANPNENVEEPIDLTNVLRFLSNEIAMILENNSCLKVDITRNIFSETVQNNNLSITIANTATPSDGPSSLPLTPTKVRYEKRAMTQNSSIKQENEPDVICMYSKNETMYVCDYLEDIPDTERKKEDNAPKLSSRFLRESVNAEQRRLIVGYMIRLGVHYYYSCNVIYQAIKLFNVAIDRILVETNDIQLIALACLWITLKREAPGHKIPSATEILQLAKDLYINQETYLLIYEKKILSAVKFNTRFADPFSLLSYYILNVNRDGQCNVIIPHDIPRVYFCASYMIDLSMLDENLCDIPACVIAIAAVELSFHFVYSSEPYLDAWCQIWRSEQSLTEWEERMLNSTKRLIMQRAVEHTKEFGSNVIYKKYMRSRHGRVTNFLRDKLNTHRDLIRDTKSKEF